MLGRFFDGLIKRGTLRVTAPDGSSKIYGTGEPYCAIALHGRWTPYRLALRPEIEFGEAYMDSRLTIEVGDIAILLHILIQNLAQCTRLPMALRLAGRTRRALRRIAQYNPAGRARRNVAHHYDLSGALYDLFLDRDRQYSCAYFASENDGLEKAQVNKKLHIEAKLRLDRPGLRVLDIGSGWGGLGLEMAGRYGADVYGVTLSTEQLGLSNDRAKKAGLADHCRFALQDYRILKGPFDRIVSVGMFEHVGVGHYDEYFRKVAELLSEDGVALIHTIGRSDGPGATNPWITKYIFPGGYVPALSEVLPSIERTGLIVTDIEVLRLHYAETLKAWRERFIANRAKAAALCDERFCRMWEFYLAASEMTFRYHHQVVFQIQLAKNVDSLPLTRDYMFDAERHTHISATGRSRAA
jgi:cyclopropane-fatty-acyl-phospholipid synthase